MAISCWTVPPRAELIDPTQVVFADIAKMGLKLEPSDEAVIGAVDRVAQQHVLRPQQVLPVSEAVALGKELLSRLR